QHFEPRPDRQIKRCQQQRRVQQGRQNLLAGTGQIDEKASQRSGHEHEKGRTRGRKDGEFYRERPAVPGSRADLSAAAFSIAVSPAAGGGARRDSGRGSWASMPPSRNQKGWK